MLLILPSPQNLAEYQKGLCIIWRKYNWKYCTFQTLFKKKSLGKPKDKKGDKNKDTKGNFSFWHLQK